MLGENGEDIVLATIKQLLKPNRIDAQRVASGLENNRDAEQVGVAMRMGRRWIGHLHGQFERVLRGGPAKLGDEPRETRFGREPVPIMGPVVDEPDLAAFVSKFKAITPTGDDDFSHQTRVAVQLGQAVGERPGCVHDLADDRHGLQFSFKHVTQQQRSVPCDLDPGADECAIRRHRDAGILIGKVLVAELCGTQQRIAGCALALCIVEKRFGKASSHGRVGHAVGTPGLAVVTADHASNSSAETEFGETFDRRYRKVRRMIIAVFGFIAVLFAALAGLVFATRKAPGVLATVADDPSLPRLPVPGPALYGRIVEGPEGAQTIIVLHGGPGGDFRSLQALERLSDTHRVIFYDQRGAGLSQRMTETELTIQAHLEELHTIIGTLSPDEPAILVGHSWGAILAAAYLGEHPELVQRAVLIEPGYLDAAGFEKWRKRARQFMASPAYIWTAILTGFRVRNVQGPDGDARDDFLIGTMVHAFANHPKNPYHRGQGYTAPSWRFGVLASRMIDREPPSALDAIASNAKRFSGPVLLMAGACNDWIGEPLQLQHLHHFTDARLAVIPGAGHDVVWDNPDGTLREINTFLRSDAQSK